MDPVTRFILFQCTIFGPFFLGLYLRRHISSTETIAKALIRVNLILLTPPVIIWSMWGLEIKREVIALPLAGLYIVLLGYIIGRVACKFFNFDYRSEKTYIISSSLANQGFTMGGFLCYLLLGEKGVGLASIYLVYFMPYIFLFIFPYARLKENQPFLTIKTFKDFFLSPDNLPLYATAVGYILNISNIPRPSLPGAFDILLMLSIALYYITLGMNFQMKDLATVPKEQVSLALSKFLIVPAGALLFIKVCGLTGSVATVVLVQSFMPAAIYAVIASILFDLDKNRASGYFIVNSILFILFILPILLFFQPWNLL